MVFDHFQEVRRVLGTACEDGVAAVDLARASDLAAVGHASGVVRVWDVIKGGLLKAVDDACAAPAACIRFVGDGDATLVAVDGAGGVAKIVVQRRAFAAYVARAESYLR